MSAVILCAVIVVGLVIWIASIRRRDRAEERARGQVVVPDPVLVDRPYDPSLCGYCNEASRFQCPACTRSLCAMHQPADAHHFCFACEAEWDGQAGRRRVVLLPITLAAMAIALGLIAGFVLLLGKDLGTSVTSNRFGAMLGAVPFIVGLAVYSYAERLMRRWFRKRGQLPQARTLR